MVLFQFLFVSGGDCGESISFHRYSYTDNVWLRLPDMQHARDQHHGMASDGSDIVVCGGGYDWKKLDRCDRFVFNVAGTGGNWRDMEKLPFGRELFQLVAVGRNQFVAIGGNWDGPSFLDDIDFFNGTSWRASGVKLATSSFSHSAVFAGKNIDIESLFPN